MGISDRISAADIILDLDAPNKRGLLETLAGEAAPRLGLPREDVLKALQAREALGSTGLGRGVALPHARLKGDTRPVMLFARLRKPITVDDVLASPMIASPLHRLDCCVVTDGGGAIVMTSAERARDLKKKPVHLAGYGAAVARTQNSQIADDLKTPAALSGPRAFAMAGVTHDDIDVAQIYDAFTITPMLALEDLGFCGRGESGAFVADGNLTLGGRLPANTDGGGLSSNHPGKRGIFTLIESVRQLRGEGPGVQVPDARIAMAHGLGGTFCSAATAILAL